MSGPYTDQPSQLPGIVFPNQGMQALSSVIHLFGTSVLAFCLARRTNGSLLSWQTWVDMSWPRLCVLLVFVDSWLFLFSTGILIGGAGMSTNFVNCALGIYACIVLYATSKVLIYCFLIEKVHVVWGGTHQSRLHSKVYWLCLITMTPYAAIVIMMLIGRVAYLRDDRACIIGLKTYASLSLLIYDLYINIFLTGMFLWPLFRSRLSNPRIRRMALRTLVAALAALTTSTINIAVLTIMHGRQLGWVCLGSCGTDVTMNALVLFWVTDHVSGSLTDNTPGTQHCPTSAPGPGAGPVSNQSLQVVDDGTLKSPVRFGVPESPFDRAFPHSDRVSTMVSGKSRRTSEVVFSKGASKASNLLSRIGDAFRSRDEDGDRRHQMSVQVTITTEQQNDIMMDDVKYNQRSESINESVTTNGPDVEKGEMVDEQGRVALPSRRM